jgi:DNA polymerase-3 subunit epsilon
MFNRLFSREYRRKRALARAAPGPMREFLAQPLPPRDAACNAATIVSVDLETTGLNPAKDDILSVGLVEIQGERIKLNTAWHQIVSVERDIPAESAVIHQITDDAAAAGRPLDLVLPELLRRLQGKAMLVHFARIEQTFIDAACRRLYGAPFVIPIIDTLALGQRVFERRNHTIQPGDLRLFNLRPRYNLPNYKSHNALNDAIATAELFLAMRTEMAPPDRCRLHDFVTN